MISQKNGFKIEEGKRYITNTGEIMEIRKISKEDDRVILYSLSDGSKTFTRVKWVETENRFKSEL